MANIDQVALDYAQVLFDEALNIIRDAYGIRLLYKKNKKPLPLDHALFLKKAQQLDIDLVKLTSEMTGPSQDKLNRLEQIVLKARMIKADGQ